MDKIPTLLEEIQEFVDERDFASALEKTAELRTELERLQEEGK